MDRSRGASVEDVGQEESKRGYYRKIAWPLRRLSENKSTRIESDPLQEAESEEMTAPGPPWTPEEAGCSDRWGRLAKALPRLQRCSSAKRRGCTSELTYSRSSWPVRRQGRSGSGNDVSAWGYGPPQQTWRKPNEASARGRLERSWQQETETLARISFAFNSTE